MPKPLWAPWRLEYVEHADELDRCIFCEPEEELLVHRGELALVVLNKFPYSSGHLLVAPHRHLGDFGALDAEEAAEVHRLEEPGGIATARVPGLAGQVQESRGVGLVCLGRARDGTLLGWLPGWFPRPGLWTAILFAILAVQSYQLLQQVAQSTYYYEDSDDRPPWRR